MRSTTKTSDSQLLPIVSSFLRHTRRLTPLTSCSASTTSKYLFCFTVLALAVSIQTLLHLSTYSASRSSPWQSHCTYFYFSTSANLFPPWFPGPSIEPLRVSVCLLFPKLSSGEAAMPTRQQKIRQRFGVQNTSPSNLDFKSGQQISINLQCRSTNLHQPPTTRLHGQPDYLMNCT